jgi:hypothetical protein
MSKIDEVLHIWQRSLDECEDNLLVTQQRITYYTKQIQECHKIFFLIDLRLAKTVDQVNGVYVNLENRKQMPNLFNFYKKLRLAVIQDKTFLQVNYSISENKGIKND